MMADCSKRSASLQASDRSGSQELGRGGLGRYGDGSGWGEHDGVDDGGEGAAGDG